jgi:CheY-like chemotaxis protein
VILCTGYNKRITEEKALDIGARNLILKPFKRGEMASAIRSALDQPRQETVMIESLDTSDISILIVDDERPIRRLLSDCPGRAGYDCQSAESVAEAREMLAAYAFDLVTSDINMPGTSGLELIRYLRNTSARCGRGGGFGDQQSRGGPNRSWTWTSTAT